MTTYYNKAIAEIANNSVKYGALIQQAFVEKIASLSECMDDDDRMTTKAYIGVLMQSLESAISLDVFKNLSGEGTPPSILNWTFTAERLEEFLIELPAFKLIYMRDQQKAIPSAASDANSSSAKNELEVEMKLERNKVLAQLLEGSILYEKIPERLFNDQEFMLETASLYSSIRTKLPKKRNLHARHHKLYKYNEYSWFQSSLHLMSHSLKNDADFALRAILINAPYIAQFSETIRSNFDVMSIAVMRDPYTIAFVAGPLVDSLELALIAVSLNSETVELLSPNILKYIGSNNPLQQLKQGARMDKAKRELDLILKNKSEVPAKAVVKI